jgi:hypothetical protein
LGLAQELGLIRRIPCNRAEPNVALRRDLSLLRVLGLLVEHRRDYHQRNVHCYIRGCSVRVF